MNQSQYLKDLLNYHSNIKIGGGILFILLLTWIGLLIAAIKIKPKDDNSNANEIKSTKIQLWIWFAFVLCLFIIGCVVLFKYSFSNISQPTISR